MFFFFNDTATTEIYTLSLHDALPIYGSGLADAHYSAELFYIENFEVQQVAVGPRSFRCKRAQDRKSTRLNSSHLGISYAVFCLKKKTQTGYAHRYQAYRTRYATDVQL